MHNNPCSGSKQVEKLVGTTIEKKTHNREKKKFIFILNEILTINSFIS